MSVLPETAAISCDERARLRELIAQRDRATADEMQPLTDEELANELRHIDLLISHTTEKAATSNRAKGRLRELQQGRQQLVEMTQEARLTMHGIQMRAANAEARLIAGCPEELRAEVDRMAQLAQVAVDRWDSLTPDSPTHDQTHAAWEAREAKQLHQDAIRACINWDPDK